MFVLPWVTIVIAYNWYNEILYRKNTVLCLIKVNSNAMKLYHLSEITLLVKSHNKSIELGSLAWGEKRKWRFFQFFSENIEHLKKIIILYKSCYFTMHIRIFWLQIVEFDIFYHLEQSLWIFICFHPFLFTCGRLPLKKIFTTNIKFEIKLFREW